MATVPEIKDLIPFLEKKLGAKKILEYHVMHLTQAGDNFGSVMLKVIVKFLENITNETKTLNLVVKSPVTNDDVKLKLVLFWSLVSSSRHPLQKSIVEFCNFVIALTKIFQPDISFVKENAVYANIYPLLYQLQKDANVPDDEMLDFLPKCYGTRISLDPNAVTADSDGILLLENLLSSKFQTGDKTVGFNKQSTCRILEKMAEFHGLPVALRYLKPEIFENFVLTHLKGVNLFLNLDEHRISLNICDHLRKINVNEELYVKLKKQLHNCENFYRELRTPKVTQFSTMVHRDLWVNNLMFTVDVSGNVDRVKFFDFQAACYHSATIDVSFFLATSVEDDVLQEHFHTFLKHYFQHFLKVLKRVGCPLDDFTYDLFYEEYKKFARLELSHIIFMFRVLMAKKSEELDVTEVDDDYFFKETTLSDRYFDKLDKFIKLYVKLGLAN